jgi:hypothetical protein
MLNALPRRFRTVLGAECGDSHATWPYLHHTMNGILFVSPGIDKT